MTDKMLSSTHVLFVIAPTEFRDEELLEPKEILTQAGAQVTVASTRLGEATGMLGARVTPDTTIDSVKASDYQAVVVVGGMGSQEHLWHDKHLHKILTECNRDHKVLGAICLSSAALARAGVLHGKQATVYATPESLKELQDGGAKYSKEHVVRDGHVITADGPEVAGEFGHALVQALLRTTAKV